MTAIEELQTAVSTLAERVGPSIVGIGRGTRGSGVVIAAGKVLTNAHNLRGDEVTVTFADGRQTRGTVAGWDGDGDLAVIDVDTAGASRPRVGRRRGAQRRDRRLRRRGQPRRRDARDVRARVRGRARVPRPGWPAHRRQRRAHRSPRARLVRWRAARRRRQARRPQHQPDRRGLLPGAPGGRRAAGPHRRARAGRVAASGRGSAWPSPRTTSPAGCAGRSASPSATASWSAASRTAAWPRRPGSRPAT